MHKHNKTEIRPITDLKRNTSDIENFCNDTGKPVYLTRNGHGSMVIMSQDSFEELQENLQSLYALKEAEQVRKRDGEVYTDFESVVGKYKAVFDK